MNAAPYNRLTKLSHSTLIRVASTVTYRQAAVVGIALTLLFTAGCQTDENANAASIGQGASIEPREVQVVSAIEEKVTRAVEATGTLAAQDQVALAMKVTGRIKSIKADLGDRISKGQIIAEMDSTDFQISVEQAAAALQQARIRLGLDPEGPDRQVDPEQTSIVKQARASLNEAKLNRDRAQQLYDQKLIPRSDFDTALTAYQIAEGHYQDAVEEIRNRQAILAQRRSELEMVRQQLAYCMLRSPIDGAVSERLVSAGQYVTAGAPIVNIVRVHPLRLRLPVPERAASEIRIGQRVRLKVDPDPKVYEGRVTRLSPAIDESNRTLLVEAEVPNERGLLRPGAFARAELLAQAEQPAIFVPTSALVTFAGIERVITVKDGKSVEQPVKTGRKNGNRIEILEGIQPREEVVVHPGNLAGGQPVVIARR